jgi:hypothetical protein
MWQIATISMAMLLLSLLCVLHLKGLAILQIYIFIVAICLNLAPFLNCFVLGDEFGGGLIYIQLLVAAFFQVPLYFLLGRRGGLNDIQSGTKLHFILQPILPAMLFGFLVVFWYVALHYDIFYRRVGFEVLAANVRDTPAILYFIYKMTIETSTFIIIFLLTVDRFSYGSRKYYFIYKIAFTSYISTFFIFHFVNSRMQLVVLLICAICTQPKLLDQARKKWLKYVGVLILFILSLTLIRESVIEETGRVDYSNFLLSLTGLIAGRLDMLQIFAHLKNNGFSFFELHLSGVLHLTELCWACITNSPMCHVIKESLITSPSVVVANELLSDELVDFPKSFLSDAFLSFGAVGIFILAFSIAFLIRWVQKNINDAFDFRFRYIMAIYMLPFLLAFDNEFFASIIGFIKWLPLVFFVWAFRPKNNYY